MYACTCVMCVQRLSVNPAFIFKEHQVIDNMCNRDNVCCMWRATRVFTSSEIHSTNFEVKVMNRNP